MPRWLWLWYLLLLEWVLLWWPYCLSSATSWGSFAKWTWATCLSMIAINLPKIVNQTYKEINCREDGTNMFKPMFKIDWLAIVWRHGIIICTFTIQGEYKLMDQPVIMTISTYQNGHFLLWWTGGTWEWTVSYKTEKRQIWLFELSIEDCCSSKMAMPHHGQKISICWKQK